MRSCTDWTGVDQGWLEWLLSRTEVTRLIFATYEHKPQSAAPAKGPDHHIYYNSSFLWSHRAPTIQLDHVTSFVFSLPEKTEKYKKENIHLKKSFYALGNLNSPNDLMQMHISFNRSLTKRDIWPMLIVFQDALRDSSKKQVKLSHTSGRF